MLEEPAAHHHYRLDPASARSGSPHSCSSLQRSPLVNKKRSAIQSQIQNTGSSQTTIAMQALPSNHQQRKNPRKQTHTCNNQHHHPSQIYNKNHNPNVNQTTTSSTVSTKTQHNTQKKQSHFTPPPKLNQPISQKIYSNQATLDEHAKTHRIHNAKKQVSSETHIQDCKPTKSLEGKLEVTHVATLITPGAGE